MLTHHNFFWRIIWFSVVENWLHRLLNRWADGLKKTEKFGLEASWERVACPTSCAFRSWSDALTNVNAKLFLAFNVNDSGQSQLWKIATTNRKIVWRYRVGERMFRVGCWFWWAFSERIEDFGFENSSIRQIKQLAQKKIGVMFFQ